MHETMPKTLKSIAHPVPVASPLWRLGISELAGHNVESKGRETVNKMLNEGWLLLHLYTLRYRENGNWRERPMAILGRSNTHAL